MNGCVSGCEHHLTELWPRYFNCLFSLTVSLYDKQQLFFSDRDYFCELHVTAGCWVCLSVDVAGLCNEKLLCAGVLRTAPPPSPPPLFGVPAFSLSYWTSPSLWIWSWACLCCLWLKRQSHPDKMLLNIGIYCLIISLFNQDALNVSAEAERTALGRGMKRPNLTRDAAR